MHKLTMTDVRILELMVSMGGDDVCWSNILRYLRSRDANLPNVYDAIKPNMVQLERIGLVMEGPSPNCWSIAALPDVTPYKTEKESGGVLERELFFPGMKAND